MIRNVIFDVGNVLIEFDWHKFLRTLFDEETAQNVSPAMWGTPAWDELDRGVLSMEEVTALFIANAPNYEPQIREALDRIGECPSVKPYTIAWIRELKAQGFRVYYLSNYFQTIWEKRPDIRAFADETDGGIFSWQEKVIKPSPESFQRLLDR
ncbi:MAG: HAD family phosphatase, partial [Oscillospiraceae bacterium]|nr:HAD family phosphatase [Oscillospiraceae bacterium]